MKKREGLTLIELLLSLALISIIILGGTNFFIFGSKTQSKVLDEFNIQSNVRLVSQRVNSIIRDSSGIFLLDKDYPESLTNIEDYLTEGWNYLMLNKDKTKLIEWTWDGTRHKETIIMDSLKDTSYDLIYNKEKRANENRLLGFTLDVYVKGDKRTIESGLEGVNTLQVIDRSYGGIANTLAYRNDPRLTDIGVAQAAVSFVIDKSGSMNEKDMITGKDRWGRPIYGTRMDVLKSEATKMIEGLAEYDNVYLSITPFASTANSSTGDNLNEMLNIKSNINKFIGNPSIIQSLNPYGGTNTGDGMRRGYYTIKEFNDKSSNQDKTTKNFMIILVDGDTTFSSVHNVNTYEHYENGKPINHTVSDWRGTYTFDSWSPSPINFRYSYRSWGGISYSNRSSPYAHSITKNGITYQYADWKNHGTSSNPDYKFRYVSNMIVNMDYVLGEGNIDDTRINSNDYNNFYSKGAYTGLGNRLDTYGQEYVSKLGDVIQKFKNTREDGIEVFIIGFSADPSPTGLQQISDATKSKHGTQGNHYKYYQADTGEALETVLNEIKFQISEALWHIGGPN